MRLCEYIDPKLIYVVQEPGDKKTFLRRLVQLVAQRVTVVDPEDIVQRLMAREEEVTTGIGHGVAIPHATIEGLAQTYCIIVQIPPGMDFAALDASPVHVIFLLLSPPGHTGLHIRLLARIARLLDNESFVTRVAQAGDEQEILALIVEEDRQHV